MSSKINDDINPQSIDLRFVYFANSNKEKRIPGLGPLFKAFEVSEGDVICLEKKDDSSFTLTFLPSDTIQIYNGGLLLNDNIDDVSKKLSSRIDILPLQQIFYGAPGTGKSFTIDRIADDENSVRTTFHPDSDYASFVGAYKPTMAPMPINAFVGTTVHHAKNAANQDAYENKIVYKYVPQAFLKAYVEAWKDLDNPHFLIIEEINRGNCAQIFGDLFQLLDRNSQGASSYAIHADEDIRQFLSKDENGFAKLTDEQKDAISGFVLEKDNRQRKAIGDKILSGEMLLLPPNLHIWATMNTSDQSLFPIDSAFKRRWDWKYVPIDYNPKDIHTGEPLDWKFQIGDNQYSWGEFLKIINPEIYTLTESSDKQMGYFFAKANRETGVIPQDVFLNKVLFYLWTDVFKDYDVSSDLFKNPKENRSFRFTDFFGEYAQEALENFIANLNLSFISVYEESEEDVVYNNSNQPSGENNGIRVNGKPASRNRSFAMITEAALKQARESGTPLTIEDLLNAAQSTFKTPTGKEMKKRFFLRESEKEAWLASPSDATAKDRFKFDTTLIDTNRIKFYAWGDWPEKDEPSIARYADKLDVLTVGLHRE